MNGVAMTGLGEITEILLHALRRIASDEKVVSQNCVTQTSDESLNRDNRGEIARHIALQALFEYQIAIATNVWDGRSI